MDMIMDMNMEMENIYFEAKIEWAFIFELYHLGPEITNCSFYKLMNSEEISTNSCTVSIHENEMEFLNRTIEHYCESITYKVIIENTMQVFEIHMTIPGKTCSMARFVTDFNGFCAIHGIFIALQVRAGELTIHSGYNSKVHVIENDTRFLFELNPFQAIHVSWNYLLTDKREWYMPIIAMEDTPIMSMYAEVYRKNNRGVYNLSETVVLPKGIYYTVQYISDILNRHIEMRGERNGFIYTFSQKKHRLVVCAAHKQPEPSFLRITPLHANIGLTEEATIVLQTGSKLYLNEFSIGFM
jgi:hypothetical protein